MIISILLLSLTGAIECTISETSGPQQCFGAVGKPLSFLLPIGENKKISLKKNSDVIINIRGDNTSGAIIHSSYRDRSEMFRNGTFKFETVTDTDSGVYSLETYDLTGGKLLHLVNIHLEIRGKKSNFFFNQQFMH